MAIMSLEQTGIAIGAAALCVFHQKAVHELLPYMSSYLT